MNDKTMIRISRSTLHLLKMKKARWDDGSYDETILRSLESMR
jgi:hypothetical protein